MVSRDTIITTTIRETLGALPIEREERDRLLRRTAEACAARGAVDALDRAAERGDTRTLVAGLLRSANAIQQEGPNAATAREDLRKAIGSEALGDAVTDWTAEMRQVAGSVPGSGACTIATALQLWDWTTEHFRHRSDCPPAVFTELAESLASLLAARCQILETLAPAEASSLPRKLLLDLCHLHAARTAAAAGTLCAELVHGYRRHPAWDAEGCASCYGAEELDELEGLMPGFASTARAQADVIEADGSHPFKAGPCVRFNQVEGFTRLRAKLDGCLTGARLAGDRAAAALAGTLATSGRE